MKNKYLHFSAALLAMLIIALSLTSFVSAQPSSGDTPYRCYNNSFEVVACPPTSVFSNYEIGKCYRVVPENQGRTSVVETPCPNSPVDSGGSGTTSGTGLNEGISRDQLSDGKCEAENLNSGNCGIIRIIVNVINFLSAIAGIALVASLMISGYLYMTARDNAGQVEKAKSRIIQTSIALTLFIFMYALLNFLIPGGLGLS